MSQHTLLVFELSIMLLLRMLDQRRFKRQIACMTFHISSLKLICQIHMSFCQKRDRILMVNSLHEVPFFGNVLILLVEHLVLILVRHDVFVC